MMIGIRSYSRGKLGAYRLGANVTVPVIAVEVLQSVHLMAIKSSVLATDACNLEIAFNWLRQRAFHHYFL